MKNEQSEQEPLMITPGGGAFPFDVVGEIEQEEQEPVAVVEITYGREPECYVTGNIDDFPEGVFKLYAAPVRTKDLTGQDLCDLEIAVGWKGDSHDFDVIVHAVIAKFKEKNK